jgi:transposase
MGATSGGSAMLSFSGSLKVFVALEACDMRKGFNGLHALVAEHLGEDPRSGALFVFSNRRRSRLKVLYLGSHGFLVAEQAARAGHVCLAHEHPARRDEAATRARGVCDAHRRDRPAWGATASAV